jgi:hypothetical protein
MIGMSGASKTISVGDNVVGLKGQYVVVGQGVEDKLVNELKATRLDSFMVQKFEYVEELQVLCLCCFDTYFDETINDCSQQYEFILYSLKVSNFLDLIIL